MTQFLFQTVPDVLVERGATARLGEILAGRYPVSRLALVTDGFLAKTDLIHKALESLRRAGWQVLVCADVQADPPDDIVLQAVGKIREFGARVVVGFGGGSSMDVAKLVAVLAEGSQDLEAMYGVDQVIGGRLPLVQIPTTAGTGSEVTAIAIVTTGSTTKSGIVSRQLYADMAILDATVTTGLPAGVTSATGIDAMVHAIEAYTSLHRKNPLSDHSASLALKLLTGNLLKVVRDGQNVEARESMLLGAMLAGQAFANAPVAAVHALAYPLGGHFHIPHGLSNALVLGPVLRFNLASAADLYAQLAEVVVPGIGGSAESKAERFIDYMGELVAATGLSVKLRDHGVKEDALERLAADAMQQQRLLKNNPRVVREEDALSIYRAAY